MEKSNSSDLESTPRTKYGVYAQYSVGLKVGEGLFNSNLDAEKQFYPSEEELKRMVINHIESYGINLSSQLVVWSIDKSAAEARIEARRTEWEANKSE